MLIDIGLDPAMVESRYAIHEAGYALVVNSDRRCQAVEIKFRLLDIVTDSRTGRTGAVVIGKTTPKCDWSEARTSDERLAKLWTEMTFTLAGLAAQISRNAPVDGQDGRLDETAATETADVIIGLTMHLTDQKSPDVATILKSCPWDVSAELEMVKINPRLIAVFEIPEQPVLAAMLRTAFIHAYLTIERQPDKLRRLSRTLMNRRLMTGDEIRDILK